MESDIQSGGSTQSNCERADEMRSLESRDACSVLDSEQTQFDEPVPNVEAANFNRQSTVADSQETQFDEVISEKVLHEDMDNFVADSEETQFDGMIDGTPHKTVTEDNINTSHPDPDHDTVVDDSAMAEDELTAVDDGTVPVEDTGDEPAHEDAAMSSQPDTLCQLPIARIKRIMKFDPEVGLVNQEATLLVAKATELFIRAFSRQIGKYTLQCKRKTLQKRDIDEVIERVSDFEFLEGVFEAGY